MKRLKILLIVIISIVLGSYVGFKYGSHKQLQYDLEIVNVIKSL